MISKVINGKEYLFVQVPETSWNHTISNSNDNALWLVRSGGLSVRRKFLDLPKGDHKLIGIASELTEEQWIEILGEQQGYDIINTIWANSNYYFDTGLSLISSLNLQSETTLIIQKQ